MNLLFLTQTYPRVPGDTTGPFIRDLARGLVRRGDRVTVLAPHAPDTRRAWDDDGVAVRTFRYAPERFEVLGYSRSLARDERPRLGAALVTPLYAAAALGAVRRHLARERRAGRPVDLVHAHWVVPNGLVAAPLFRRGEGTPLAVGLHGSDVFMAEKPGVRRLVGRALARTRLLTGCSPELVERVCALGFPDERSRVIPYGVELDLFRPAADADQQLAANAWRERLGIPPEGVVLLSVGRMATKKGYQVLLEALPELLGRFPRLHVVLAGDGDLLPTFEDRVGKYSEGADRVHFPGAVYRDTLPDLYRAADLFTLPAVHDPAGNVDGLPNVILEAMATGLPVVASRISGIPLAVIDPADATASVPPTGRLVPEKDPQALAAALSDLLARPEEAAALGTAGRKRAEAHLSWDAVAGRYREGYEAVLDGTL